MVLSNVSVASFFLRKLIKATLAVLLNHADWKKINESGHRAGIFLDFPFYRTYHVLATGTVDLVYVLVRAIVQIRAVHMFLAS